MDERTGTGYVLYEGTDEYDTVSFALPPYTTVFQAELVAGLLATRHVIHEARSLRPRYVKLFSDSQSALVALDSRRSSCRTVCDAIEALDELAQLCHTVRLVWIPSHPGIPGNERADSLAKRGTAVDALESPYLPLRPLVSSRGAVFRVVLDAWSTDWNAYQGGRMTKEFLPQPNSGQVHTLLMLD